jgi:hypothetical protein
MVVVARLPRASYGDCVPLLSYAQRKEHSPLLGWLWEHEHHPRRQEEGQGLPSMQAGKYSRDKQKEVE